MSGRKMLILGCAAGAIIAVNVVLWLVFFRADARPVEQTSITPTQPVPHEERLPEVKKQVQEYIQAQVPEGLPATSAEKAQKLTPEERKELVRTGVVVEDLRPRKKPARRNKEVKVIVGDEEPLPEDENPPADIKIVGE
jgi:hypothetical protein